MEEKQVIESELYGGKVKVRFFPISHQYWMNGKRKSGATTYIGIKDKSRALMSWKGSLTADFLFKKLTEGPITKEIVCLASYIDEIEKEEAADTGSKVHDWAEKYIKAKLKKGPMPAMPEEKNVQVGVNAFLDWEKEHEVKFLSSERVVYSKKHDYMGKMDIEAKIDGKLCVVDLKTSNGIYNTVNMQTAAYLVADKEESKRDYKGRWAIRLSKYDEKEYFAREERKKEIKRIIATYRGKQFKEYEIPPYQAFEAKFLDETAGSIEFDFEAFLNCKKLYDWDKATDYYLNQK